MHKIKRKIVGLSYDLEKYDLEKEKKRGYAASVAILETRMTKMNFQ